MITPINPIRMGHAGGRVYIPLVQADGAAHRGLDVQCADILPVLLEQRHEEVDSDLDVGKLQPQVVTHAVEIGQRSL